MSMSISYDLAAFNIAQLVKYKEDVNSKEGRLGVWRFSQSIYYVSSSECKIAKLWFDFLRLIKVIVDCKDTKFNSLVNASEKQFGCIESAYNSKKYEDMAADKQQLADRVKKLSQRLEKAKEIVKDSQKANVQMKQEKTALSSSNQELLKAQKALTDNVNELKKELAATANSKTAVFTEAQKQLQEVEKKHTNEKEGLIHQFETLLHTHQESSKQSEDQHKDNIQSLQGRYDKLKADLEKKLNEKSKSFEDLQKEKTLLVIQEKSKDELISKLQNEKKLLISEKNHDEKKIKDNAEELEKIKKEHHHHLTKQGLDLQLASTQLKKDAMEKEEELKQKDEEINKLKAQIASLVAKDNDSVGDKR